MTSQHLSKSRYIAGLQCLRRLWLIEHEPAPYEEPAPGSPMDIGGQIGRKAHLLFPGGVLVDEPPWRHTEAVARTAALMADGQVPAIFEAAFEYDNIRIRVDVLERLADGTWGLREVKSSSGPKDLFARVDVHDPVAARLVDLPNHLQAMRDCLSMVELPAAEPGSQCGTPYACEFWDRCTAKKPADSTFYLPRLSQASKTDRDHRRHHAPAHLPKFQNLDEPL